MAGSLSHSPADVIRRLLIALGAGSDPDAAVLGVWPVYVDLEPPAPDNVLTVYDTTPRVHGRTHPVGTTQLHYGVQVRIRATTTAVGWTKGNAITEVFDGMYQDPITVGGTLYHVHAVHHSGIIRVGKDSPTTKRSLFTINALTVLKQA